MWQRKVRAFARRLQRFLGIPIVGLCLCLLTACGTQDQGTVPHAALPFASTYVTPTPDVPLLPPGTYEAQNNAAGTATRVARLTQVPTWPPGQPRSYPSADLSTPFSPIATRVAGVGIIAESGMVGDLSVVYGVYINQWREEADGQRIDVYAGAKSESNQSNQGVVVVRVIASNNMDLSVESYESPSRAGALEIIDAIGSTLLLRSENGSLFGFDVSSRQWVTPPIPSATVSPIPSVSPLPTQKP
jgi:hypothetical protein